MISQEEEQTPPPNPPSWLCPLAAKGKGDRVSWAQLQGDQVGDMTSFLGEGGDGVPGLDQAGEGIKSNCSAETLGPG